MNSEFKLILKLLWHVIKFLLDATTWTMTTALLLLAMALPWRWMGIYSAIKDKRNDRDDLRVVFFLEFCKTLFDVFCVPLGLLGVVLPTRTCAFFCDAKDVCDDYNKYSQPDHYNFKLRGLLLWVFYRAIADVFCLAICLPSLVVPTRAVVFARNLVRYHKSLRWDQDKNPEITLNLQWLLSPFIAFAEIVGFLSGLLTMLTFVRSCQTIAEVQKLGCEPPADFRKSPLTTEMGFHLEVHLILMKNAVLVLVDIVFAPFILVLFGTGLRWQPVWTALRAGGFSWKARRVVMRQFGRLVLDLTLALPLLLILLTWYRSSRFRAKFCQQCIWKRVRGRPSSDVENALPQDQISFTRNVDEQEKIVTEVGGEQMQQLAENKSVLTSYHMVLLQCTSLLFLDVLCFPLVLMLTLTVYRFSAITGGLLGTQFHRAVLKQTGSLLLDVPFMFMGALVICTLIRADLVWHCCCRTDAGTAWDRRRAVGWQLLFLLRDLAMLPPLLVTVATLYRLPCLLMSLKVRRSRLMTEDAEMHALEFHIVMPRPKGHPGFYLRASKAPNLSGLVSMQMQLTGDAFWAAVAAAQGGMIASAGRAALPFALRDGLEVNLSAVQHGRPEAEITVEFQRNVKATTMEKFWGALPQDVEMLLQLEGKDSERRIVLLTLPITVGQMLDALHAPDGRVAIAAQQRQETLADGDTESERINALRGAQVELRDAWWSVVLAEFVTIISDAAHLLMLLALLLVPWRFVLALWRCAGEPASQRAVRLASWTLAPLRAWDEECDNVAAQIGPLTNTYAKAALVSSGMAVCSSARAGRRHDNDRGIVGEVESVIGCCCCTFCPFCPNYNEYDTEDCEFMSRSRGRDPSTAAGSLSLHLKALNHPLDHACKELKRRRKAWPEELEFVVMGEAVDALLLSRAEYFFWLLLLPEVHVLVNNFTGEEHARVSQMVRSRIFQVKKMHAEMQTELATQFGIRCEEAKTSKEGRIKSKAMCESIIREELCEGLCNVKDILFGPILVALLLVTVYRVPNVCALVRFPLDIPRVKAKVKFEAYWLFIDIWRFCQTLLLGALLLITVVKFPDFFSGLQPAKGILVARNWALFNVAELAVGILELLFLLTAWKTYRLLLAALVFMLLAPAAMLSAAFPTSIDRRLRFSMAGVFWCALLACALLLSGGMAVNASMLGLLLLAFLGFISNDVPGWVRPRGDMDWWSPSVRCTLPNSFALLGMVAEASVLLAASMMLSSTSSELELSLKSWEMLWHSTSAGLLAVAASLLLVSVPMVAEEEEQEMILTNHAWRRSMQLLHEVCFLPVVLILAQACAILRSCSVALLYFTSLALLAGGVWDNSVPREELLDIRVVGLGSSGRQLMLCAAVFAAAGGHSRVFVLFGIAAVLWTASWIPKGSSIPWAEFFRVGLQVGALVAGFAGLHYAVGVWGATALLATTVALVARRQRHQRIVSSDLPKAMEELVQIQARMKVWDDSVSCELMSLDVSEQGAAMQLLKLESELPFERLRPSFLEARRVLWQQELLNANDYSDVLFKLKELKEAIHEPTTRILLKQVLRSIAVPGRPEGWPPFQSH